MNARSNLRLIWPRHTAYKASGLEWVTEVPAHWEGKRLRYSVALNPSRKSSRQLDYGAEVSFIPMEAIGEQGALRLEATVPVSEVGSGFTYFADGDVVVAKITPCFENGKGALASGLRNGMAFGTTELHVLRADAQSLDQRFLYYLTTSHPFRRLGEASMYGAGGQKRVPEDFIKNFRAVLPPPSEQRHIAAYLDDETVRLDGLIEKRQRMIALLQEKRAALITHAVTRGIDPDVPFRDSGVEWLGRIPAHWAVTPTKHLAQIVYGLSQPPEERSDGVPFVRATNIDAGEIVERGMLYVEPSAIKRLTTEILRPGDIIVVRSGAYTGDSAIVTGRYAGAVAGYDMVVRFTGANPQFMAWQLLSAHVTSFQFELVKLRAAQPHLNAIDLGETLLLVPPIEEQQRIGQWLGEVTTKVADGVFRCRRAIQLLTEYRDSLITAAVTGQIDVRALAP